MSKSKPMVTLNKFQRADAANGEAIALNPRQQAAIRMYGLVAEANETYYAPSGGFALLGTQPGQQTRRQRVNLRPIETHARAW